MFAEAGKATMTITMPRDGRADLTWASSDGKSKLAATLRKLEK